jgi:uncharacterized protein YuzE
MKEKIVLDYDKEADVLYISFGNPQQAVTEEMGNIGVRINPKTNQIVGLTIIEFLKTFRKKDKPIQITV